MREKRHFGQRTKFLKSNEVRRKYLLVYEGQKTESIYFETLNQLKKQVGIHPLIELVSIIRSYNEKDWSNPQKIIERMNNDVNELKNGIISYETLLNQIIDYICEENKIKNKKLEKNIWDKLYEICSADREVSLKDKVEDIKIECKYILEALNKKLDLSQWILDIDKMIEPNFLYDEKIDKICFIVDRDKKSFTEEQYEYVLKICREKGYGFFITNPCFEFWLLLHYTDGIELDKNKLLENSKISSRYRYIEVELKKYMKNFKKNKYDASLLIDKVDVALNNVKNFCEDIEGLKNEVGSNIGDLIKEIRSKK